MTVFEEVKKLEILKDNLRKEADLVIQSEDLTEQEKRIQVGKITDDIYDIDQEIKRLKKMNPTVIIKEEEKINPLFIVLGIAGIIFIINRKRK